MAIGVWSLEFLNVNSQRKYPLAEDGSVTDATGSFVIPNSLILELDLPIGAGQDADPSRFFIKHIGAYATGYSIVVGYQPATGAAVDVATALIARQLHTRNRAYALGGIEPFEDSIGKVVIGDLSEVDAQPAGFFTFALETARLDPDAIRPQLRGVSGLVTVTGSQQSPRLVGDIELVAGRNQQIVPVIVSGQNPRIIFNAISGEGTIEECVCEGEAAPTAPIRTINRIAPTPSGDFTIVGGDCVRLDPIPNGLRVVDTCAKPCCGPDELERITQDFETLLRQADQLQSFVDRLAGSVEGMASAVLGSRLGDSRCDPCDPATTA